MGAAGAIIGGIGGAITGATQGKTRGQKVIPESGLEREARELGRGQVRALGELVEFGPGVGDVNLGAISQRDFARALEQAATTGGLPTEAQLGQARGFAEQQFAPQQVALEQALEDQRRQAARLAGARGITQDDPILQAKLAQQRVRGTQRIAAEQSAFASQFGQDLARRQLQLQEAATGVRSGLASQALQNRLTLAKLGSSIFTGGLTARAKATQAETPSNRAGGGLGGFLTGGLASIGAGAGAGSTLVSAFGGSPSKLSDIDGGSGETILGDFGNQPSVRQPGSLADLISRTT